MRALRPRARVSYCETEEPDLDQYVFCEKCSDYVYEYCSIHGPLLVIPDDKVPTKHNFPPCVPRAALTIPHVFLHLNFSSIPGAGIGVFTTLTLPKGVRFGPYRGVKTTEPTSDYSWQIYGPGRKPVHVVDASDGARSNWMRFVNCSRNWREQNLLAYQYQGELYYRTIKIIPRYTELLVFYGTEFANKLNIDLAKYNAPKCYAQKYGAPAPKKTHTIIKDTTEPVTQAKKNHTTNIHEETKLPHKRQVESIQQDKELSETNKSKTTIQEKTESVTKSTQTKKITTNIQQEKQTPHKRQIEEQENGAPAPKKPNTLSQKRKILEEKVIHKRQKEGGRKENKSSLANHKCDTCNYETVHHGNFKSHLLMHSGDKTYSCNVCSYKSNHAGNLKTHLRTHTEEKPYSCNVCSYKCNHAGHLKTHLRTHTGEKPYSCNVCSYKCNQAGHLKIHLRTHTGEKPYSCNVCSYKCNQASDLKIHLRTHTGEKPYSCNVCSYKCTRADTLKTHLRTHTEEKPYSCNVCSYKCNQVVHLKTHLRTHTGEKPYSCNVCSYKCNHAGNLKIHLRTHTGEKPYSCNVCSYKCNHAGNLKIHLRTHTGEKPYSCNVCSYKCYHAGHLKTHLRTHTGEKPYSCNVCSYKCNHAGHLKTHLRTHTGEKPHVTFVATNVTTQVA